MLALRRKLTSILQSSLPSDIASREALWISDHFKSQAECEHAAKLRAAGQPLQYVLGVTEFCGLDFKCRPPVLIPRDDTAVMVNHLVQLISAQLPHARSWRSSLLPFKPQPISPLDYFPIAQQSDARPPPKSIDIFDLCCGSGCIGISIMYHLMHVQSAIRLTGVDVDPAAIALSQENAQSLLPLELETKFVESSISSIECEEMLLQDATTTVAHKLILSNPPYIPSQQVDELDDEVRRWESRIALDGGPDGLQFYRSLLKAVSQAHVIPNCTLPQLALEVGVDHVQWQGSLVPQWRAVDALLHQHGYTRRCWYRDPGQWVRYCFASKLQP